MIHEIAALESNRKPRSLMNGSNNQTSTQRNTRKNRSTNVIDLIKSSLIKDPEQRITIDEFLNHEWIRKYNKNV